MSEYYLEISRLIKKLRTEHGNNVKTFTDPVLTIYDLLRRHGFRSDCARREERLSAPIRTLNTYEVNHNFTELS
jgi:hypothetical protein